MSEKSTFYLVREEILPEAIKKTIKVKEILKRGEIKTINEAVEKMGLSRSAYYKYKDFVFPFYEASKEKIITLSLLLEHKSGVLSKVLNTVADDSGSIMTINQGIPLHQPHMHGQSLSYEPYRSMEASDGRSGGSAGQAAHD